MQMTLGIGNNLIDNVKRTISMFYHFLLSNCRAFSSICQSQKKPFTYSFHHSLKLVRRLSFTNRIR